jgi:opacity protein-like surface antigen
MKRSIVVAVLAVAATACSSSSDVVAESTAENTGGVNDVDINKDIDEIKIETYEGSVSFGGGEIPADLWISLPPQV